jgi:ABC-type protease/lipase transport system fused ATPase/permease subunit
MFIVFAAILFYLAFTEGMIYSIFAVICLGLGVLAHILRNKALKRIKK